MFRKTKLRIFALIMIVATLIITLMLSIIFIANSRNSYARSMSLLEKYMDSYNEVHMEPNGGVQHKNVSDNNTPPKDAGFRPDKRDDRSRMFDLATFYSVFYDNSGNIVRVNLDKSNIYSEQEVTEIANHILSKESDRGIYKRNPFMVRKDNLGTVVAFIDNTMEIDNFNRLFVNSLIVGFAAWATILILSWIFVGKIVKPLEENDLKQKQFISDAGHELKTPISVISANSELLARELGDSKWLANIQYENERMSALIKQLLDLARADRLQIEKEQLDMSRLVSGGVLPFESVAFEHGLELSLDIENDILVDGNRNQLSQLVAILVDNAINHSSDGKEVKIKLDSSKKHIKFSVINNGNPIPNNIRERLFERFFRVDEARTEEGGHYGLGLAIAKAIVDAHHGKIEVDCYDGLVEFRITLPKA